MSAIGAIHQHTGGIPRRINTLGNRLMILGYLDELHAFSADDVNRVAADLANENEATDATVEADPAAAGQGAKQTVLSRLENIEERLTRQEAFTRRAGSVIQQFLNLVSSDAR
jgi:hypothetical protein